MTWGAEAALRDEPMAGPRVIAVMNQKGGVGKTTTTLNLAHALALEGQRVLALDLDPQGQLTASLGMSGTASGLDEVLRRGSFEGLVQDARPNLRLVPAGPRLMEVERGEGMALRGQQLKQALAGAGMEADWVLVDCPPSAGVLGMNALFAATDVLMPVSSDYLALHGLSRLIAVLRKMEQAHGHRATKWLVLTRFQERRRLAREVRDKLLAHFPGRVLATEIRESVALSESPGFGRTIFDYRPKSRSAAEYRGLATDLMQARTMRVMRNEAGAQ